MSYHTEMRIKLDSETARWFRHAFRPGAVAQFREILPDLSEIWDGGAVLDLGPQLDNKKFLAKLAGLLLKCGLSTTYEAEFVALAKKIAEASKISIIERLATIHEPPAPVEIKHTPRNTARKLAVERILERRKPDMEG